MTLPRLKKYPVIILTNYAKELGVIEWFSVIANESNNWQTLLIFEVHICVGLWN